MLQGFLVAPLMKKEKDQVCVRLAEVGLELQAPLEPALGPSRIAQGIVSDSETRGQNGVLGIQVYRSLERRKRLVKPSKEPEHRT